MSKVTDLSKPADTARVVDLSRPAPTRTERVLKTLGVVALVAGTIAAGASAARNHCKSNTDK